MGLDQYAYTIDKDGEKRELAYWRKHPSLHGWMEDLWHSKGRPNETEETSGMGLSNFNCVPVPLAAEDLDSLERAIKTDMLPETSGFFFGDDASDHYRAADLKFIQKARESLDAGLDVFYDSWW